MSEQYTSLILDGSTTLPLKTSSVEETMERLIHVQMDDSNEIKVTDPVRTQKVWTITATLTNSEKETLISKIRTATSTDYPKLRVWDKSTTPYYNDYKIYFPQSPYRARLQRANTWNISIQVRERTKP